MWFSQVWLLGWESKMTPWFLTGTVGGTMIT